jgi:ribosome-associated protein
VDETSAQWAVLAAQAASSKKGTDPLVLDVGDVLAITDAFVIVSAPNTRLVRTISEEIEEQITAAGGPKPVRIEGLDDLHWVLMDYGPFVVHVFLQETRDYYELERLWADVPRIDWNEASIASIGPGPSR